jgi:hypothetical protein
MNGQVKDGKEKASKILYDLVGVIEQTTGVIEQKTGKPMTEFEQRVILRIREALFELHRPV